MTAVPAFTGFVLWLLQTYVFKGTVPGEVSSFCYVAIPLICTLLSSFIPAQTREQKKSQTN